ncbi:MAG: hypothetical protein MJ236_03695 [Clostridia bacterium]|nr:hypothetical protein [Clostridia bacterium]
MTSLDIRAFDVTIRNFVRDSELPAEAKKMVLQSITKDIEIQANEEVNAELIERKEAEEKNKEQEEKSCQ